VTAQVTPVFDVPATVATNCCCHLCGIDTAVGEMTIETGWGADTITAAELDFVVSAALTAVMA
jgi:hypothetical protein